MAAAAKPARPRVEDAPLPADDADIVRVLLTETVDDEGNARCAKVMLNDEFTYSGALGWLHWTGTHWKPDPDEAEINQAIFAALKQRRKLAVDRQREDIVKHTAGSVSRLRAVKYALQAFVGVTPDDFNRRPDELNVANGVLNLRTKALTPHSPAQRFLYCLGTPYVADADDAPWREFLAAGIAGGADMLEVVQASMGYWITGETAEEKIWYLWGETRSGKGVTMETLQALLGNDLFGSAQFNTFTKERDGSDQGFDLAHFHSARVVFAEESNRADYLNPGKVKAWTGGGSITCSFKHKDQFTYPVRWKGVLASNHALKTDAMDDAIWGRVQIWHYPHSHLGEEDLLLKEQMRSPEYQRGVLRFLVDGAARWYELRAQGGLRTVTPPAMTEHKERRRTELDLVGRWIEENCTVAPALWTTSETLYTDFFQFCKDNGQKAYSNVEWGRLLNARGFENSRKMSGGRQKKGYHALGLLAEAGPDAV